MDELNGRECCHAQRSWWFWHGLVTMEPISRRRALQLGALGAAGVIVGGWGLARELGAFDGGSTAGGGAPGGWPTELRSSGGLLRVELDAARRTVDVAGRRVTMLGYTDSVPGPTLRLVPGDRLQVRLRNSLDDPTNLHVHGLHVSPVGNGDNPFLTINPGETFDYEYQLPAEHPTGTFWYHPHLHGMVADQIFGGLYGAIIVEEASPAPVALERVLIISDVSFDADGNVRQASMQEQMMGREGELLLVNGQVSPVLVGRPGERERWRVINACPSRFLRLAVAGHQLQVLGLDQGLSARPEDVTELLLAPGNRADLMIVLQAGTAELRTLGYDRGMAGMGMMGSTNTSGPATLATLTVTGDAVAAAAPVPDGPTPRDLREVTVARRRELTMNMGMGPGMGSGMGPGMGGGMMSFTFDGRQFDHHRTDQQVAAGDIEEWTILNTSPMDHPFHLHVWPMQVVEVGGRAVELATWRDVVNVPAGGSIVVRIPFEGFTGRTVYHCHILDHEDLGMMGVIEVG